MAIRLTLVRSLRHSSCAEPPQAGTGMGPEQHQLYNDKGAGVDNIFLPQQGLHDGNDQRGGIAVNDIDLLHSVQLESFAEQRIQKQKYNVHSNGDAHGIKQPGADLRRILRSERRSERHKA